MHFSIYSLPRVYLVGRDISVHKFTVQGLMYDQVYVDTAHTFILQIKLMLVGGEDSNFGGQVGSDRLHFDVQFFMSSLPMYDEGRVDLDIVLTPAQREELQVHFISVYLWPPPTYTHIIIVILLLFILYHK